MIKNSFQRILYVMEKYSGIIIFYLSDKGYGYLRLNGTREEFHFRAKNVMDGPVSAGDQVSFVLREGRQGNFADEILRINIA